MVEYTRHFYNYEESGVPVVTDEDFLIMIAYMLHEFIKICPGAKEFCDGRESVHALKAITNNPEFAEKWSSFLLEELAYQWGKGVWFP